MNTLDPLARESFKSNPSSVFGWIMVASYQYYIVAGNPLLSDTTFDKMCKYTLDNYDKLEHNHCKRYITKEHLKAGSLYDIPVWDYPWWVRGQCLYLESKL